MSIEQIILNFLFVGGTGYVKLWYQTRDETLASIRDTM